MPAVSPYPYHERVMPRLPWIHNNRTPASERSSRDAHARAQATTDTDRPIGDRGPAGGPALPSALEGPRPDGRTAETAVPSEAAAALVPSPQLSEQREALAPKREREAQ